MQTICIIVLDDHPVVREGLIHMINREPDLDVVADSGVAEDMRDLVKEYTPDVLLLDIGAEYANGCGDVICTGRGQHQRFQQPLL